MSNTYRNMLWEAQQSGYAIPAFNYTDIWEFLAITEAAEELDAPVYAATAKDTVDALGYLRKPWKNRVCKDQRKLFQSSGPLHHG